jgi:cell division control protein 45
MNINLKKSFLQKLTHVAPKHGLTELSYPSFIRCYGSGAQPLSAADAVEAIRALLDVAGWMHTQAEIERTQNSGEHFENRRLWTSTSANHTSEQSAKLNGGEEFATEIEHGKEPGWWTENFWIAYDALTEYVSFHLLGRIESY